MPSRSPPDHQEDLRAVIRELNEDGFRVIAVAYKEVPTRAEPYAVADECDLVLLGYIAFLDPPKETAAAAMQALARHGVRVKVLTGDNEVVTRKVCRDVGLDVDHLLLGAELERLSDSELAERVEATTVFAKLTPQQKARVIGALHRNGHVVGFLGDGINDGPALKAADVGISVDTAVDIAKESADIILLEKSLLVLEDGVIEGREVFGNIIKYIKMSASSNFGNMFSVLGASAFLPFLPMAPVQILLNNLLYDFSQTAVATDNVDAEYVEQPRRWDIGNIGRFMLFIGPISSIFDYATFFTMLYVFDAWHNAALFQTGWFVESLLSQTLIVHVIRTGGIPFVHSRPSLLLGVTTLAICVVGIWLPTSPFAPRARLHAAAARLLDGPAGDTRELPAADPGGQGLADTSFWPGVSTAPCAGSRWAWRGISFPWCSRKTRSAEAAAASECVTSTPAARRLRTSRASRSSTTVAVSGSRLPVGSSARMSAGRCTNARATATRCSSPPDNSRGMLSSRPPRPTSASSSLARCSRVSGASPSSTSGSITFCCTERCGRTWNAWNTKPSLERRVRVRASSCSRAMSTPSMITEPTSGRSSPAIRLSSVDLPEPDSPTIAMYSPPPTSSCN